MVWWKSRQKAGAVAEAKKPSRLLLQALEPRLMFDGAAVQTAIAALHADAPHLVPERAEAPAAERLQEHAVPPAAPAPEKQVVFVDTSLANYQGLLAQLPRGAEVVLLESGKDGLAQIAQWAGSHQGYAAMHILSHGQNADLLLARTALTSAALEVRQGELAALGGALKPGGDILLYGCDIGAGTQGAAFVARLSELSHADVAASSDATGAARLGGNWTLERHNGQIEAAALRLDYDGLLARPVTGTTDFTASDGNSYNPSGSVVNASPIQGWDFSLQLGSTNNGGQTIIVEKAGAVTTETVDGYSDGTIPISYFKVQSNDGSRFTLNSIGVVLNGYDSGTAGGNLQLIGYINGAAVSGATLTLNVGDALQGSGGLVTFTVSGNSAFQGIDSFRVMAASGHTVTGMIGIGAINAINFGFAPALTASGGSAAYSSGMGAAVTVDSGITLSDSDSATQVSAAVSITGGFQSGEDVLAFANNGSTMGNISASYSSGTGVLTLTSSGGTATLAQWQAALRAVTYQNSSLSPNTANRTISFATNDGAINSNAVTRTVTVAANAAPVLSNLNGDSPTFTEKGSPVKLDTGTLVTVSDSDTVNFNGGNLTVHISANGQSAQDVLGIDTSGTVSLSSGTSTGSVVTVGGISLGVVTTNGDGVNGHDLIIIFNSNATPARVATLVNALTYSNSSNDPSSATRTVNVSVNDGRGASGTANVTVAVVPVNDAPSANATAANPAFTGMGAVSVFSGANIAVVESSQSVILMTLTVSGLKDGASEILSIDGSNVALSNGNSLVTSSNGLSVSVSVSSGTATVAISSAGITASIANSVINGITYNDTGASISSGNRVVTLTGVKDSGGTSNGGVDAATLAIACTVNVAVGPAVVTSSGSAAFAAGNNSAATPVAVDSGLTVSDVASPTLANATVRISGNFHSSEDVLAFSANPASFGNITGSYNTATGVLSLVSSGSAATLAQWQAALRSVTYTDSAVTPNTATRTISFQIDDGSSTSSVATRTVTVAAINQTPIVTASGGSAAFVAGDNTASTPVALDPGITLSDRDNVTLASATVRISGNFQSGQDVLSFSNTGAASFGNITGSYNSGTGVLTLTSSGATATLAQWQAALRAVNYTNSAVAPNAATRTISFSVNDGSADSAASTRTVSVTATDQTPIVTGTAGSVQFTAGDGVPATPVAVDTGLAVNDLDNTTLASATVRITGNFHASEDVLAFGNTSAASFGNITGSYNSGTGVLTLTSSGATATLAQWQAVLRAVTYTNTVATPDLATRTVSISVSDGSKSSIDITRNIAIALPAYSPVLGASSGLAGFVMGATATPVVVDAGLTVSDRDSATLTSASVRIASNFHAGEDVLAFSNGNATRYGNITASYNGATGVLSLSSSGATATVAQWQAALRAITYSNSAASPNTATRAVSFSVNDGGRDSQPETRGVYFVLPAPQIIGLAAGSDTGTSASDGVTAISDPILRGTALPNTLVVIYVDGVPIDGTNADNSGAWSYTFVSTLGDASHSVTAIASYGGVSSQSSTAFTLVIDTRAPASPVDVKLTSGTAAKPAASGKAEAGSTVSIRIDGVAVGSVQADGAGAWAWQGNTALADGQHSVRAVATDLAGNASGATAELKFTVDTRVPLPPAPPPPALNLAPGSDTGSSASDGLTNQSRPTINGTAQANSTVSVLVDGTAAGSVRADANGAWSYTLGSALADGRHSIEAVAENAGGKSAPSAALALTIDTAAPGAPAIAGLGANPAQPEFSGSAEANSIVTIYVDNAVAGTAQSDASGRWSYRPSGVLGEGTHTVRAVATDAAGNSGAASVARSWSVDSAPPAVPAGLALAAGSDTGSSGSDGITSTRQPTIEGMAAAGSRVTVSIDGVAQGSVVADAQGTWSFRPGAALADGAHRVTAVAANAAGVSSAASAPLLLNIDTGAPRLVAITALDATATSAGLLRYEVQFSEAVALTADAFGLLLGGQARASFASITPSGEGRYIVQLNASGEGSVALTLRAGGANDLAGNALGQGGGGTSYLLQAPPPVAENRPGSDSKPASPGGGTPSVSVPIAPTVVLNTVAAGATAVVNGQLAAAGEHRLSAPPLQAAWGMDRFAGSGVADVFTSNGGGGFAARDFQDMGPRSLEAGRAFELRLPPGALSTRSAQLAPSIHAQLSDGRPLPAWIRFDAKTGRFLGTVPAGWKGELSLEVRAQDEAGHEHVTHLQLRTSGVVEVKAEGAKPTPAEEAKGKRDGKEAPAKAALNEQLRQYGKDAFDQQLAAWLASDETA